MKNRKKFLFESYLAGILMAFAWSLRGQFGPLLGALIPGAASVALLALLMKEEHWRESMGKALLLAPLGFAVGGHIAYGKVFEAVAHAAAFGVLKDEFAELFAIGLIWGAMGGTFLGFGFSEKPLNHYDVLALAIFIFTGIFILDFLKLPISDLAYFLCGLLLLQVYNLIYKKSLLLFFLFLIGALAFGAAFLFAGIVLGAGYQGYFGNSWAWWIYRDPILGFTAGVFFWGMAAGLQQFKLRRFPAESMVIWQQIGFGFWVVFISGINAAWTVLYWLKSKSFQSILIPSAWLAALFAAAVWFVLSKTTVDYFKPKIRPTLKNAVLVTFAIWSLEAILKQTVPFHSGHWEGALTFFILFFVLLAAALPLQIKALEQESWK